jgi:signal transduction histidine kinase
VEVRIETDDGGVMVTVEDNGVGIGSGDLERVMLPFEQAQASSADNRDGVGLGLPIARSLVELHGGTLRLHSEQGAGTRAEVWLPRADLVCRVLVG